jgi:hypothetical protein
MQRNYEQALDDHLERFEQRLPNWAGRSLNWILQPKARWVRLPLGVALILAGIVGFLPILGFWMVPLGLLVIAKDLPPLRPPMVRLLEWVERKWPSKAGQPN